MLRVRVGFSVADAQQRVPIFLPARSVRRSARSTPGAFWAVFQSCEEQNPRVFFTAPGAERWQLGIPISLYP